MNKVNETKTKLWGKQQVWITFFAGVMFLFCGCIAAGNTNTVFPYFAGVKGWNIAGMMFMVSIGGYASVAANLLFGQWLMKIGAKRITIIGLIGGGFSALLMGTTQSQTLFMAAIVLNFIFAGAYQAAAMNTLLTNWFPKKKGIVFGWATMGLVLANVLWVPYITRLFDAFGLTAIYVVIALLFFAFAVLCILFVKNTPEEAGAYPDNDPENPAEMAAAMELMRNYKSDFTIGRLLKTKQTWQLTFGWGLPWLGMMAILSQYVPRLLSLGYSINTASFVMMISGIIALPASWFFGFLDSKIGCKKASLILAGALVVACLCALLHGTGMLSVWLGAICLAMGQGALANLVPSMMGTWFGRLDFAAANRLLFPMVNIVATFGMTLVGIILAQGMSYDIMYVICAVLTFIGFVIIVTVKDEMIGAEGQSEQM